MSRTVPTTDPRVTVLEVDHAPDWAVAHDPHAEHHVTVTLHAEGGATIRHTPGLPADKLARTVATVEDGDQ